MLHSENEAARIIIGEAYYVFPGTTLTVCCLTLRNGYHVLGESACVSPADFDAEQGRRLARQNALNKMWTLEAYLRCEEATECSMHPPRVLEEKK